jgi:hypothetical protein
MKVDSLREYPSHRYDLPDFSCVNEGTQFINRKLRNLLKDMRHVSVVDTNDHRQIYTTWTSYELFRKERIAKAIGQTITTFSTSGNPPISLKWEEVPLAAPTVKTKMGFIHNNDDGLHKNSARSSCRLMRLLITRNEDFFG